MSNPFLAKKPDKSIAKALKEALKASKDGQISAWTVAKIIEAAHDGGIVDDVEFRDLRRIIRTQPMTKPARALLEAYLAIHYPLTGPFVYPGDVENLDGSALVGSKQCAALVQHTFPGQVVTWREGIPVRGNGHLIQKGTAVATFEDGFYPNRDHGNHAAYYVSQDNDGIVVIDQWKEKENVASRTMKFLGRLSDGLFERPSNNGDALSLIMKKV